LTDQKQKSQSLHISSNKRVWESPNYLQTKLLFDEFPSHQGPAHLGSLVWVLRQVIMRQWKLSLILHSRNFLVWNKPKKTPCFFLGKKLGSPHKQTKSLYMDIPKAISQGGAFSYSCQIIRTKPNKLTIKEFLPQKSCLTWTSLGLIRRFLFLFVHDQKSRQFQFSKSFPNKTSLSTRNITYWKSFLVVFL